jgi:hypothetical protein
LSGFERKGISNVVEAIVTENGEERVCGAKTCLKGAVCGGCPRGEALLAAE